MQNPQTPQQRIISRMRPGEKIALFHRLRDTAWQLKQAALRQQHPEWSAQRIESEVRKIFLYART